MNPRASILAASLLGVVLLPAQALAQKKVPGEKWRQTVSMQMAGMSMPARTTEICAPVGKANEALTRPEDSSCSVYDVKTSGNSYSARMKCTGSDAMEGSIQTVSEGNTMHGTTTMKGKDGEMTMKFDSTRLGACEAIDYSDYKPPVAKALPPQPARDPDASCKQMAAEFGKPGNELSQVALHYAGPDASCAKSPTRKAYCAAAQTPGGFFSLERGERSMAAALAQATGPERQSPVYVPLTASLQTCGLASTPAAINTLQQKLLGEAEVAGAWEFLIIDGSEAQFASLVALAKRECSGRSYTNAANARYLRFCGSYGAALVRGDRQRVLEDAGADSDRVEAAARPATIATGSTSVTPPPAQDGKSPASDDSKERAKEKAREAVDKGKKLLRGILGGG
jgi:hypothetical protein